MRYSTVTICYRKMLVVLKKRLIALFERCPTLKAVSSRRAMSSETRYQPTFDPLLYTQGRWLDRDKERGSLRRLHFDFDALMDVAVKCSLGARRVLQCVKKEGGFNRVFIIHLDNHCTVVARLPTRLAGPPGLTVSSEVATLQFVKERTTVPVPSVLSWSATSENSVGAEYMILEAMPGVLLKDVWNSMTASQHVACIRSIGRLCKQLCQLTFPAYGSLYFNSGAPPGAVKLDEIFCVGPVCAPQHWNCGIDNTEAVKTTNRHRGPWDSVEDQISDLMIRTGPSFELLDVFRQTLRRLADAEIVQSSSDPTLFHPDFHTRNIFVDRDDHTRIAGVIDWQSAAVAPAFCFAAETPDFAQGLPDEEDPADLTVEEKAANDKVRADVEFCSKTWWVMQQTFEKVRPASRLDVSLLRVLAAPSFGWIDKEVTVEYLLNDLAKEWTGLSLPGQSIYRPSEAEDVVQRLDEYQAKRQMQDHLTQLLRCDDDGWVSNDRWEEVLTRYRLEYSRFVESVVKTEECQNEAQKAMAIDKANRLWPYDQR